METTKADARDGKTKKKPRSRINFSMRQLEALETVFQSSQYPDVTVLKTLSERMDLPMEKMCTWFQNRRSKFRKESKKGHIMWMRDQLFTQNKRSSPYPVAPADVDSMHVLSPPPPPEVSNDADISLIRYRMPTSRVHHFPGHQGMTLPTTLSLDTTDTIPPITVPSLTDSHIMSQAYSGCGQPRAGYGNWATPYQASDMTTAEGIQGGLGSGNQHDTPFYNHVPCPPYAYSGLS